MTSMANKYIFKHVVLVISILVTSLIMEIQAANDDYDRYLMQLFQKYGNGNTMQYEGLVNLMRNLNLRQIDFDQALSHNDNNHNSGRTAEIMPPDTTTKLVNNENNNNNNNNNNIDENEKRIYKKQQNMESTHLMQIPLNEEAASKANHSNSTLAYKGINDLEYKISGDNDVNSIEQSKGEKDICLSPLSLMRMVNDRAKGINSSSEDEQHDVYKTHLTPASFKKLCPALITLIDHEQCRSGTTTRETATEKTTFQYSTANDSDDSDNNQSTVDKYRNAWIYAGISIFVLSSCGLLSVLLIPLMKFNGYEEILDFLIATAVGTLSGDALMHLLPHALIGHEHQHKHQHQHDHNNYNDYENSSSSSAVWICACTFFTTVFMFMIEFLIPIIKGENTDDNYHQHEHHHQKQQQPHQLQHNNQHNVYQKPLKMNKLGNSNHIDGIMLESNTNGNCIGSDSGIDNTNISNTNDMLNVCLSNPLSPPLATAPAQPIKDVCELNMMLNNTALDLKTSIKKSLSPLAHMVIIGDGLHNLTDGLAIGAAFATDPVTGLATAFAVLCHELPHELGDFALLLQTGVSMQRAICLNLISSILSVIGMMAGLLIAGLHSDMTQWIYAATAGSFLYISLADLIPAIAKKQKNFKSITISVSGILIGGIIMVTIAINEQHLERLFQ